MVVYLIRHTRPAVAAGVCYGQSDVPLADSFHEELASVRRRLDPHPPPDKYYSSPLSRCLLLASALSHARVETDERLQEMAFGDWELQRWENIDRSILDHWASDFVTRAPPRGESLAMLNRRVGLWFEQLRRQSGGRVAVVTHAGVIRCLHCHARGMPLADALEFDVDFGDVFLLDTAHGTGTISKLGSE